MPNQPKTPITAVRIPVDLKASVQKKAAREGKTLSRVINDALREYLDSD